MGSWNNDYLAEEPGPRQLPQVPTSCTATNWTFVLLTAFMYCEDPSCADWSYAGLSLASICLGFCTVQPVLKTCVSDARQCLLHSGSCLSQEFAHPAWNGTLTEARKSSCGFLVFDAVSSQKKAGLSPTCMDLARLSRWNLRVDMTSENPHEFGKVFESFAFMFYQSSLGDFTHPLLSFAQIIFRFQELESVWLGTCGSVACCKWPPSTVLVLHCSKYHCI